MLFDAWFEKFEAHADTRAILESLRGGGSQWVSGVWGAARAFVAASLIARLRRPALILCLDDAEALTVTEELRFFLQGFASLSRPEKHAEFQVKYPTVLDPGEDPLVYFPACEYGLQESVTREYGRTVERLLVLKRLAEGEAVIVVCSLQAATQRLVPPETLLASVFSLEKGRDYSMDALARQLTAMGYRRESAVEEPGQFSVRGGILDLATPDRELPARLEFEGDRLERMRFFDPGTQRGGEEADRLEVLPFHELVMDEETRRQGLRRVLESPLKPLARQQWYDRLASQRQFLGQEWLVPFFHPKASLFDYLKECSAARGKEGPWILADQPQQMRDRLEADLAQAARIGEERARAGQLFPEAGQLLMDFDEFSRHLRGWPCLFTALLPHTLSEFKSLPTRALAFKSHDLTRGDTGLLVNELLVWLSRGSRPLLVTRSPGDLARLRETLAARGYPAVEVSPEAPPGGLPEGTLGLAVAKMEKGFACPALGLVLVSDEEVVKRGAIQAQRVYRHRYRGLKGARPIESFAELKEGQYAVHVDHGIGIFRGVVRMQVDGFGKDFVCLEYAGAEKLYVPVDQVNLVQKYLGGEEAPRLYKLGGNSWASVRERVKQSVQELAQELLQVYARRQVVDGLNLGPDTAWQKSFDESFPFEETPDQAKAIEQVKRDMQSSKPMDRLICGDVGFGKTEVAMRAAFKAVMAGYQVAVLVPTTILAQQHFRTFSERMADYPVRLGLLSRFRSPAEQRAAVRQLAEGKLDLVIGTHRLLQKDVSFKKLGLVVVDEEQRFGVRAKEQLKRLRAQVEMLALSATPIPRTLHFSLSGLRDMSVIETPPLDRLPIRTYVLEDNQALMREAIMQELRRGGQVFFVHNRVKDIQKVAERLRSLIPEAHVAVGHGQMEKHELEKVMMEFLGRAHDVLVATTIIESGLDIPNVNTIVINHAEDFGLSQLYQLRGRVGRAEKQAYAYLFYPKDRSLPEVAEKRLAAIEEFTDLGAGFKVAMRDLEIRGTGNILGPEQHGHVAAVGFDLYCHLLNEAVATLKGEEVEQERNPALHLDMDAYLPEDYVPDPRHKMDLYKRLAAAESEAELEELASEIRDRFGEPPSPVRSLLEAVRVRILARRLGLSEVSQKGRQVVLRFWADRGPAGDFVEKILGRFGKGVRFLPGPPQGLAFSAEEGSGFSFLKRLLPTLEPYVKIMSQELVQAD